MDIVKKVIGNFRDRNIVNIQFIPFNKKQEEIKRSLKLRKFDLVRSIIHDPRVLKIKRVLFAQDAAKVREIYCSVQIGSAIDEVQSAPGVRLIFSVNPLFHATKVFPRRSAQELRLSF